MDGVAKQTASTLDEAGMLVLSSHVQVNTFPCEVLVRVLGPGDTRFIVEDKLLHGALGGHP